MERPSVLLLAPVQLLQMNAKLTAALLPLWLPSPSWSSFSKVHPEASGKQGISPLQDLQREFFICCVFILCGCCSLSASFLRFDLSSLQGGRCSQERFGRKSCWFLLRSRSQLLVSDTTGQGPWASPDTGCHVSSISRIFTIFFLAPSLSEIASPFRATAFGTSSFLWKPSSQFFRFK